MLLTPSCQEQGRTSRIARCATWRATHGAIAYDQRDFVGRTRPARAAGESLLSRCRALDFEA
ncbi:hypothetical protein C6Q28_06740 [Burkholderia multivorans]|nr:hypothetical protein C6Q28_06740 [Burkholderia multivorans]